MLYLNYRFQARHRKGRGIHPPFAYSIVSSVICGDESGTPGLEAIESYRQELLQMTGTIPVADHGAGPRRGGGKERRISDLVRYTAVSPKKGRLLARLAAYLKPDTMIELGTGSGISGLYLAMAHPEGRLRTCEGSPAIARLAERGFEKLGAANAEVHTGPFARILPGLLQGTGEGLLVFIDGDHRGDRMEGYVSQILGNQRPDGVMVLDDIHRSRGMYRAWKNIAGRREINLSIELFNTGILFTGENIQKGHFVVIF